MPELDATDALFKAITIPRPEVTHWGITRIDKGKPERLEYENEVGLSPKAWPVDDLSHDTIKARWGAGEYRIHWFVSDPENEDAGKRWRSGGHSQSFKVAAEPSASIRGAAAPPPGAPPPISSPMPDVDFALRLVEMMDRRSQAQFEAMRNMQQPPPATDATLAAQLAELRAQLAERDRREETDRRHRTELARLERERDEARRAAEEEDDEPLIQASDDAGFMGQIGAGIANALVEVAKKNPEVVLGFLERVAGPVLMPLLAKMAGGEAQQQTPPPTGNAPPKQVEAPPPKVEPMTGNAAINTPMSPMPDAPAAPAAVAAVETMKTKTGVPITRAAKTNGAPPKPAPAVIDVQAEEVRS